MLTQDEKDALKRIAQGAEYPVLRKWFFELIDEVTKTSKVNGNDPLVVTAEVIGRNLVEQIFTDAINQLDFMKIEKRNKAPNKYD